MKERKSFIITFVVVFVVSFFALPPTFPVEAATIGNVEMSGDATFDSDSLADSSSSQYRWHSYPGSRMTLNANQASDVKAPAGPIDDRLSIGLGGWFGTNVVNLNEILRTEMAPSGGSANTASSVSTTWHPYKINFSASYSSPSGTSVSGYDVMIDANSTMLRVIKVDSSVNNEVVLSGKVTGSGGAQWIGGSDKVILVSDSDYYYAFHVVSLTGSDLTPVELLETGTVNGSEWTYTKAFAGSGNLAVSIGIAAASEGSATAIARANDAFNQPVQDTLDDVKADFDGWLQDVPAPGNYGISIVNDGGVTAQEHEDMYYSAWTFILQDLVNELPENSVSYPYPQMMVGKPSLWNLGSANNPGTGQWESVFGYQMLSYLLPDKAWDAYLGLLSEVDGSGMIGGESLPTRMAQTAWILYQNTSNYSNLEEAYPDLKSFLDWAEDNPRWICCGHDVDEEKDLDFVTSWLFDIEFAIEIADELGESSDVTMWENKRDAMIDNLDYWFFTESDVIYQYFYDYTAIDPVRVIGNDQFKASALGIPNMPAPLMDQMQSWYMSIHRPDDPLNNFSYHKYPGLSLLVYGLLNNGGHIQAEELVNSTMRDVILGKEFAEAMVPTGTGSGVEVSSVMPSLFSAVETIELTWMLNGLRYDSGSPTAFSFNSSTLDVPDSPDALPTIEDFKDISDWSNPYNSYLSAVGEAGIFRYIDVDGGAVGYGTLEKEVSYNVDDYPKLTIDVDEVYNSQWALKVNDGSGDIALESGTSSTGVFTFDLKSITGWSGNKTFDIRVYPVGGDVKIDHISALYHTIEPFDSVSDWNDTWNATIEVYHPSIAKVTSTSSYGSVKNQFSYNVDDYPSLEINVTEVGPGNLWALKVNDGSGDIALQTDTSSTGKQTYNLSSITGWSGLKTFDIVLYVVGSSGKYVKVNELQMVDQ